MSKIDSSSRFGRNEKLARRDRLGSWKEIAQYLGRTVRTVQRWEKTSDLPVRRVHHQSGSSVFAFKHELDQWLTKQSLTVFEDKDEDAESSDESARASTGSDPETDLRPRSPLQRVFTISLPLLVVLAAVLIYLEVRDKTGADPYDQIVPKLLTTNPGIEQFPALSPDGRQVVYSWDGDTGQPDLYLRLVNSEGQIRMTENPGREEGPSWSPDGLSIAFVRATGAGQRELRVVSPLGGGERLVAEFEVPTSLDDARSISVSTDWSPDGRWVAFTSSESVPSAMGVVLWNVDTGESIRLTDPGPEMLDLHPRFSPDQQHLAFARSPSSLKGRIMVMDLDWNDPGSSPVRELPEATAWNTEPEWTVDGTELFFTSGRWPRTGLWRMPADGSAPPVPIASAGQGGAFPSLVELTQDAQGQHWRLVYSVNSLENDIWVIDLQGSAAARPLLSSSQRERFPSYAAGERIAFLSDRSGHREIWVADYTGQNWQQWTNWQSAYIWRPVFSPNGSHLAYSVEIDGVLKAYVQDEPLAPARLLIPDSADDSDLAWSRDGRRLYVSSTSRGSDGSAIWSSVPGSGEYEPVYTGPGYPLGEDPTGQWLLIAYTGPDGSELGMVNLEHGEFRAVDLAGVARHSMTLGPDGVYFVAGAPDGSYEIRRWSWADETEATIVRLDHEPEVGMAISPDGQSALLSRIMLRRSDLMMADG